MNKEFKITEPGFFRTRDGRKAEVEVVSKYGGTYHAKGGIGWDFYTWDEHGKSCDGPDNDLVAKWEEPAEQLYVWAFQKDSGVWWVSNDVQTERAAEKARLRFRCKDKRKLRRFPSEDCE